MEAMRVTQGTTSTTVPATGGTAHYSAVPGAEEITIQAAGGE